MRFYGLDLNLLVVLDALLVEQNITRAGERLFLSQPATSAALGRLREYFQDELLVQKGRKMVRTPQGEALSQPIRDLLIQMRSTLENRSQFDPAQAQRKFVLMASDYVSTVLLPQVSRRLNELAPQASLEVIPPNDIPRDMIERGHIDLLVLPASHLAEGHPSQPLFEDKFVCMTCRDHPEIDASLSFEQYKQLGHVLARWGAHRVPSVDEWFLNRYNFERRVEVITNTFSKMPAFLPGTRRLATLHLRLALLCAQELPLKILTLPWDAPQLVMAMQWNRHQQHDPGLSWLRSLLAESAAAMPPLPDSASLQASIKQMLRMQN